MTAPWHSDAPSGLSEKHRRHARDMCAHAWSLLLANPASVHYSQGPDRWEGINHHLIASHGQYPKHGDCSSTATWVLWNALYVPFGVKDVVNGEHWQAGYTGTMLQCGKEVRYERSLRVGDLVIYGSGAPGEHVAMYLGGGKVGSHGSEAGPFLLPVRYRPDVLAFRRCI